MPIDAYTGEAVVLKLDVEPWTLITDKHLDEACKKCGICLLYTSDAADE